MHIKTTSPDMDRLRALASITSMPSRLSSLRSALLKLGFVQADPIRAPARAQDLILRHRVNGYRTGDLDRAYEDLAIEEDILYAYGFLPRENWNLLHPRYVDSAELTDQALGVLDVVHKRGLLHPRDLEPHFGTERSINAWGGYSKVTTRILEDLHYRGHLRIAKRQDGIKIYQVASPVKQHLDPEERLKALTLLIAKIFSPVPETSLKSIVQRLSYAAPGLPGRRSVIKTLVGAGELECLAVEGVSYIFQAAKSRSQPAEVVRLLAPFDPVVWDRRRFEHLWGWAYRFEAYTPPSKRLYGYYALPLLWVDKVIGWANVSVADSKLVVETGFVDGKTRRDSAFRKAFKEEINRFSHFLDLPPY